MCGEMAILHGLLAWREFGHVGGIGWGIAQGRRRDGLRRSHAERS